MMTNVQRVKKFIFVLVLVLFIISAKGQYLPQSPCASIFQYQNIGGEWVGIVALTGLQLGQAVRINLKLSLNANLPNNFPGTLELYYSRDQTLQNIIANKPVIYKVRFPVQNVIPRVVEILVNGRLICSGEPDYGALVSEIQLEHTLQTQLTGQQLAINGPPPSFQVLTPEADPVRPSPGNENVGQGDSNFNSYDYYYNRDRGGAELNFYPVSGSFVQQSSQRPQTVQQGQQGNVQFVVQQQSPQNEQEFVGQVQQSPTQQFTQRPQQRPNQKRPTTMKTTKAPPTRRKPSIQRPNPSQLQSATDADYPSDTGDKLAETNKICGTVDPKYNVRPLVVGGEEIRRGTWPWLAAIYLNLPTSLSFQCGGSLITNRLVLSSAHCFFGSKRYTAQDVVVFLGRHNIRNWNETGSVADSADGLYIHPDYKYNRLTFDADIAIILLRNEVRFTSLIRPVCLWPQPSTTDDIVGARGIVVGWGRNEAGQKVTSIPKKIETTIVSDLQCVRSNEQFRVLTSNRTFCAGDRDGNGPCTGDSGGGLMIYRSNRWWLRGTVSASLSDTNKSTCNLDEYVIYVDVSKFLEWIKSFMVL